MLSLPCANSRQTKLIWPKQIFQHISQRASKLIAVMRALCATCRTSKSNCDLMRVKVRRGTLRIVLSGALMQIHKRRGDFIRGATLMKILAQHTWQSSVFRAQVPRGIQWCRFFIPRTCFCCCTPAY